MSTLDPSTELATGAYHLLIGKYWALASFVMLVYDHLITFSDEVEKVWKQRTSGASMLFFINRYGSIFQYIIVLDAFHDPRWTKPVCERFVWFEGTGTIILVAVCQLLMILRVYALYGRSIYIIVFLLCLWAAQIIVSAVGVSDGFMAPLPPPLIGCILTGSSKRLTSIWVAPLITDSFIFGLTLWRARRYLGSYKGPGRTLHVLVRDGALYFFVIFLANALNLLIYMTSPADLKAIGASFSQLITNVMVSRLVLNLRQPSEPSNSFRSGPPGSQSHSASLTHIRPNVYEDKSFMVRTIETLGAELHPENEERLPTSRDNCSLDARRSWVQPTGVNVAVQRTQM